MTLCRQREVSVFETTIRILGGLLSAYEFSGDEVFLGKYDLRCSAAVLAKPRCIVDACPCGSKIVHEICICADWRGFKSFRASMKDYCIVCGQPLEWVAYGHCGHKALALIPDINGSAVSCASFRQDPCRPAQPIRASRQAAGAACRANELGGKLLHAFNTKTGVPYNMLHMVRLVGRNPSWTRHASTLSEFGTEQLEFAKLSQLTTMGVYAQKSGGVIKYLHDRFGHMVSPARAFYFHQERHPPACQDTSGSTLCLCVSVHH